MAERDPRKRVVITGLGAVTPAGHGLKAQLSAFQEGRSCVTRFNKSEFIIPQIQIAGRVPKTFDPDPYLTSKERRDNSQDVIFTYVAAVDAVIDAGYIDSPSDIPRRRTQEQQQNYDEPWLKTDVLARRVGLLVGTAVGGSPTFRNRKRDTKSIFRLDPSQLVGTPTEKLDLRAPSDTRANACAASIIAPGDAAEIVRLGKADIMIAGGGEAPFSFPAFHDFNRMGVLSTRNDEPEKASRPLDIDHYGFIISEGSVMFVLETLERAQRRGAHIYAEILGMGRFTDTKSPFAANSFATEWAMQDALADTGLEVSDIDQVVFHAAGSKDGDREESLATGRLFRDHLDRIWISTPKSTVGHMQGAAGSFGILKTALEMDQKVVYKNPNQENPIEEAVDFRLPKKTHSSDVKISLINGIGLHGANASLVLAAA